MNKCKDCKWWGSSGIYDNSLKYCGKAEDITSSEWRALFSGSTWIELTGNCVTGPDFGCIHWEKKE